MPTERPCLARRQTGAPVSTTGQTASDVEFGASTPAHDGCMGAVARLCLGPPGGLSPPGACPGALPVGETQGCPSGGPDGRGLEETLCLSLGWPPWPQNHRWPPCQGDMVGLRPASPAHHTLGSAPPAEIRTGRPQDLAPLVWALLASVQPCWSQDSWDLLGHTRVVMPRPAGWAEPWGGHGQE